MQSKCPLSMQASLENVFISALNSIAQTTQQCKKKLSLRIIRHHLQQSSWLQRAKIQRNSLENATSSYIFKTLAKNKCASNGSTGKESAHQFHCQKIHPQAKIFRSAPSRTLQHSASKTTTQRWMQLFSYNLRAHRSFQVAYSISGQRANLNISGASPVCNIR